MRITFEKNLQRFHVPINERSRDDTPRLQSGLEALYCDEKSRLAVVGHMEAKHSERASLENGRPGTSFRQVLAPGIFKQGEVKDEIGQSSNGKSIFCPICSCNSRRVTCLIFWN